MTQAGYFSTTQKFDVTDTADSFTVAGPQGSRRAFYVCSDTVVHLSRDGDATTDSMRVPANVPVVIGVFGGDVISFVLGTDADAGSVWFTLKD